MDMPDPHVPPPEAGSWMKLLMKITGVDGETLAHCPRHDWDNVRAVGEIMICTWLYQTALYILVSHRIFAAPGQFRIDLVAASMFIATFILCIDLYMVMRSGWHLSGIQELHRGGIDISGGQWARFKAGFFLAIRIALSIGLAQLTAIFVSLLIFASDINSRIQDAYLKANAHLVAPATSLVDAAIRRATDAVTAETAQANALAKQVETLRQDQVDPSSGDPQSREAQAEVARLVDQKAKADDEVSAAETFATNEYGGVKGAPGDSGITGYGLRYRAAMEQVTEAKARAAKTEKDLNAARARLDGLRSQAPAQSDAIIQRSHDQLPGYDDALKAENAKLAALKDDLARLTAGREGAIRAAIERAPDHVDADRGFLAQIRVLERMSEEDTKIALIIILIDVISFGFELAAVLVKVTSYVPTSYAALLARDAYVRVVKIVDQMTGELRVLEQAPPTAPKEPEILPPDPASWTKPQPGMRCPTCSQIVKRGRGRPRKYPPLTIVRNSNEPGDEDPNQARHRQREVNDLAGNASCLQWQGRTSLNYPGCRGGGNWSRQSV